MIARYTGANTTGTAALADTCTTGTLTRLEGVNSQLYVFTGINDTAISTQVQDVTFAGTDSLSPVLRASSANLGLEVWCVQPTVSSGTITINLPVGSTLSICVAALEVCMAGRHGFLGNDTNTANGTTSPITASIVGSDTLGGRGVPASIFVPATDAVVLAAGLMLKGTSISVQSLTTGTEIIAPFTAGSGANTISMGVARTDCTGGSDTIAWSESIDREWVEDILTVFGSIVDLRVIKAPVVHGGYF